MTKAEKIKICREFMKGEFAFGCIELTHIYDNGKMVDYSQEDMTKALRWGLKHPEELGRGIK